MKEKVTIDNKKMTKYVVREALKLLRNNELFLTQTINKQCPNVDLMKLNIRPTKSIN